MQEAIDFVHAKFRDQLKDLRNRTGPIMEFDITCRVRMEVKWAFDEIKADLAKRFASHINYAVKRIDKMEKEKEVEAERKRLADEREKQLAANQAKSGAAAQQQQPSAAPEQPNQPTLSPVKTEEKKI